MILIFANMEITQCIIYVNTIEKCVNLANKMRERNFAVSYINGQMPQEERMQVMREFRSGKWPTTNPSRCLKNADLHRSPRQRYRRPSGWSGHQLRPPQQEGELHP